MAILKNNQKNSILKLELNLRRLFFYLQLPLPLNSATEI